MTVHASQATDFGRESGRRSTDLRKLSRTFSPGAKIGNWFEDYSLTNRDCGFMTKSPGYTTTYDVQNKIISERSFRPTDRSFVHPVDPEHIPESEYQDKYQAPLDQKKREFRSERNFNRDPSVKEHYIDRWTKGPLPSSESQANYVNFWRKD
ncbi:MAG: hypothetical protein EZS28_006546 [Streblomastix strix]|uniref:Uncharacterized protein n=1 Tax=Streblomastix strix TaxID=222440 RepID=A0A5J4WSY3_9EUKA|nr:MAG: hypothetical protein EZS28_006546 [Streblomastix strix]